MNSNHIEELGRYKIQKVIGTGGMSVVYKAVHMQSGDLVAIKTIKDITLNNLAGITREIDVLKLLKHKNIVEIIDTGVDKGIPWIAMPLLTGKTLRDSYSEDVDPIAFIEIIAGICEALEYLHSKGFIHMDLKPDNVFLTKDNEPVLIDFGLRSVFFDSLSRDVIEVDYSRWCTWEYSAPELLMGLQPDARADIYSLGCMMYEYFTGAVPEVNIVESPSNNCDGDSSQPSLPEEFYQLEGLPPGLDKLIISLLKPNRNERPGYAGQVLYELKKHNHEFDKQKAGNRFSIPYLYKSGFWGRSKEMKSYDSYLASLQTGIGGFLWVTADGGMGKTRILLEMKRYAQTHRFPVLVGSCVRSGGSDSEVNDASVFGAFKKPLETLATSLSTMSPGDVAKVLGDSGVILAEQFKSIQFLPSLALQTPPPRLPPQEAKERLFHALKSLLFRLAKSRPYIVMIDDIQWTDEVSSQFIHSLLSTDLSEIPILFVFTSRTRSDQDYVKSLFHDLGSSNAVGTITLEKLQYDEARQMISDMVAIRSGSNESFFQFVYKHSSGNPLFLMEILKSCIASRVLQMTDDGRWDVDLLKVDYDNAPVSSTLPEYFGDQLKLTISDLDMTSRSVVEAMAVWGREVNEDQLQQLTGLSRQKLLVAMRVLQVKMIIQETRNGNREFIHVYVMQGVYDEIPFDTRTQIHTKVARFLADNPQPGELEWQTSLARHREASNDPDNAAVHYLTAARMLFSRFSHSLGEYYFSKYLQLAEKGTSDYLSVRIERLRECLLYSGHLSEARNELESILSEIDTLETATDLLLADANRVHSHIHWQSGSFQDGLTTAETAIEEYYQANKLKAAGTMLQEIANAAFDAGYYLTAKEYFNRCRDLLEQTGDRLKLGRLLNDFGSLLIKLGSIETGMELLEFAELSLREFDDRLSVAQNYLRHGQAYFHLEKFELAIEKIESALTLFQQIGHRRGQAECLYQIADYLAFFRHWEDSLDYSIEAQGLFEEVGDRLGVQKCLTQSLLIELRSNYSKEKLDLVNSSIKELETLSNEYLSARSRIAACEILTNESKELDILYSLLYKAEQEMKNCGSVWDLIKVYELEYSFISTVSLKAKRAGSGVNQMSDSLLLDKMISLKGDFEISESSSAGKRINRIIDCLENGEANGRD